MRETACQNRRKRRHSSGQIQPLPDKIGAFSAFLTQLIYIKEGQEAVFHQFENVAIPLIEKYNGRLLARIRPTDDSYIEERIDRPYEIHLVEFDTEQDFKAFMQDESRKQFLHLKDQSVKASILIQGIKL